METLQSNNLLASRNPLEDIDAVAHPAQPSHMKMYVEGYEDFMDMMPNLDKSLDLDNDVAYTNVVMEKLSEKIKSDEWIEGMNLAPNTFKRTIVAIAEPIRRPYGIEAGAELVVAHWGEGFESPVHGHSTGYLFEEVLFGKIQVSTYRITDLLNKKVRPHTLQIVEEGVFVAEFAAHKDSNLHKRQTLIHNFKAITEAATLHYLPEHTRDGRDNRFEVEHFGVDYLLAPRDVQRITSKEGMYSQIGDVILVRSTNVKDYGDHYIIVTGHPVLKAHGLRVQDHAIPSSEHDTDLLNQYDMEMGLILLRLKPEARDAFHKFHNITIEDNKVILPEL